MLMTVRRNRHFLGLLFALSALPVQACGPDFPLRLLGDRQQTLTEFPETNFVFEIRQLVPRPNGIPAVKPPVVLADEEEYFTLQEQLEKQGLSEQQWQLVKKIRALSSPQQAEQRASGLSTELRLYLAGAVAFATHQDALAQRYFRQVLALPSHEQHQHQLWALYSLARSQMRQGNSTAALASFADLRARVVAGAKDELYLAIESLGEEALFYKEQGNWHKAIELYASQAALNSDSGMTSLKFSVQTLMALPEEQLQPLLSDALIQRLVISWLLSHFGEYGHTDAVYGDLSDDSKNHYRDIVALLANSSTVDAKNAERLAALSYQHADYQNAEKLVMQAGDGGVAWWIRAKLALRHDNIKEARQAYAQAAKRFPKEESWGYRVAENWTIEALNPRCRVQGEDAILALHEGEYLEAFDQLWQGRSAYWQDAADIAERVLTSSELKKYIDQYIPASQISTNSDTNQDGKTDDQDSYITIPLEVSLRELLGRRLLREGHYREAVAYFRPERQALAQAYGKARMEGDSRWSSDIERAEALYQAAVLARRHGLELLGYEREPDYAMWDGMYDLSGDSVATKPSWQTPAEQQRQLVSTAQLPLFSRRLSQSIGRFITAT